MLVFVASAGSAYDVTRVIEQAVPGEPVESIASNFTPQHVHSVIAKVSKGDCNVLVVLDGVLDGTHLPDFHVLFCLRSPAWFGFFANRLAMCGRKSRRGTIVTLFNPEQDHVADELAFAIPRAKLPDFVLAKVRKTFDYDTQNHPHFHQGDDGRVDSEVHGRTSREPPPLKLPNVLSFQFLYCPCHVE
ncbi:hypothetical protein M3Y99_01262200 [Aphelenchoides fujianensis]|nr:hypothetical protein M3Y99_01262200 [Aphelenchoides fujianensis]